MTTRKKQNQETVDLTNLAIERVRKAVMLVGQLIADDEQRASLLMAVAVDLIDGAASLFEGTGKWSRHDSMMMAIMSVMCAVDDEVVRAKMNALVTQLQKKKPTS